MYVMSVVNLMMFFSTVDAGKVCMNNTDYSVKLAPTKEILSFRAYAVYRRLNHLRRSACQLFQSESVVRIIHKVEAEVESLRIAVRKDKMMHADLGMLLVSGLI